MTPVVRISEESYERLKSWAEPLEDTAEDALQKVLDAADQHRAGQEHRQGAIRDVLATYVPKAKEVADVSTKSNSNPTAITTDNSAGTAGRMYVSLPDEFKSLAKGQGKMRGRIARKAYLERIGEPAIRPGQWVPTTNRQVHYLGYSSQNNPGNWFFGASEALIERHLAGDTLASFVFLCGLSEDMIIAVPVGIPQLEQLVRLGTFSKSDGQLKFNIRREAGDVFYLDGRLIE